MKNIYDQIDRRLGKEDLAKRSLREGGLSPQIFAETMLSVLDNNECLNCLDIKKDRKGLKSQLLHGYGKYLFERDDLALVDNRMSNIAKRFIDFHSQKSYKRKEGQKNKKSFEKKFMRICDSFEERVYLFNKIHEMCMVDFIEDVLQDNYRGYNVSVLQTSTYDDVFGSVDMIIVIENKKSKKKITKAIDYVCSGSEETIRNKEQKDHAYCFDYGSSSGYKKPIERWVVYMPPQTAFTFMDAYIDIVASGTKIEKGDIGKLYHTLNKSNNESAYGTSIANVDDVFYTLQL